MGLNVAGLADGGTPGNTNATTFHYTPQHADAVDTGADNEYNLTDAASLSAYVEARSLDKNPLLDAGDTN